LPSLQGKPEQLCLEDWVQGKLLQLHLEGGKLGFKSQEQRSNEVLNYFFLLENISMI
jgi:hypothetical protein